MAYPLGEPTAATDDHGVRFLVRCMLQNSETLKQLQDKLRKLAAVGVFTVQNLETVSERCLADWPRIDGNAPVPRATPNAATPTLPTLVDTSHKRRKARHAANAGDDADPEMDSWIQTACAKARKARDNEDPEMDPCFESADLGNLFGDGSCL